MLWGCWPWRKCVCLCSTARLPTLLGTWFSLPSLLATPHCIRHPAHSTPASLTGTNVSHKNMRCPSSPKKIIHTLWKDLYHQQYHRFFWGHITRHLLSKACPVTKACLADMPSWNTAQHDGKREEAEVRSHSSTFPAEWSRWSHSFSPSLSPKGWKPKFRDSWK